MENNVMPEKKFEIYYYSALCFKRAFGDLLKNYLTMKVNDARDKRERDEYISPICYNLSHCLECYFKSYLFICLEVKGPIKGHELMKLHKECIEKGLYDNTDLEIKADIDELVSSLTDLHGAKGMYADRYIREDTVKGYATFNDKARESLEYFNGLIMQKHIDKGILPKTVWEDRKEED